MALVASDYFRASRTIGGGPVPMITVTKASATTWDKGDVIIATSGLAVEAADGPTTGTILGVAAEDAVNGNTTALIIPALPNIIFTGKIGTGDTGTTVDLAVTHRYVRYGIALHSTGTWFINISDTSDLAIGIIKLVDAAGTAWGKVEFTFVDSFFNAI